MTASQGSGCCPTVVPAVRHLSTFCPSCRGRGSPVNPGMRAPLSSCPGVKRELTEGVTSFPGKCAEALDTTFPGQLDRHGRNPRILGHAAPGARWTGGGQAVDSLDRCGSNNNQQLIDMEFFFFFSFLGSRRRINQPPGLSVSTYSGSPRRSLQRDRSSAREGAPVTPQPVAICVASRWSIGARSTKSGRRQISGRPAT